MPDIFIVHKKAKISWIKRLAMDLNTNATWAILMWTMLNFGKNDLNHKLPHSYIKTCVTPFHKQLMECWLLFKMWKKFIMNIYLPINLCVQITNL